jgi:hypothetical protein
MGDKQVYDEMRQKINESLVAGDEYVSKPYRFLTDVARTEFDVIDEESRRQWNKYNFDQAIIQRLDDPCFYGRLRWSLSRTNDKSIDESSKVQDGASPVKMPKWLDLLLRDRLGENTSL